MRESTPSAIWLALIVLFAFLGALWIIEPASTVEKILLGLTGALFVIGIVFENRMAQRRSRRPPYTE